MRLKIRKIATGLFAAVLLAGFFYTAAYIYLNERGDDILMRLCRENGIEAKVSDVTVAFPLRVSVVNFRSPNITFLKAVCDMGGIDILTPRLLLRRLYVEDLVVTVPDEAAGNESEKDAELPEAGDGKIKGASYPAVSVPLMVKEGVCENCTIRYINKAVTPRLSVSLENADILLYDIDIPSFPRFEFQAQGSLTVNGRRMEDAVVSRGWVDWKNKAMNATLKVRGIDYFVFEPYYPPLWKPARFELQEASFSLDSYLKAQKNILTIDYYVILNNAVFSETPKNPSRVKMLKTIIALFRKGDVSVVHMPPVKTTMSKPEFKMGTFEDGLLAQVRSLYSSTLGDTFNKVFDDFFSKTQEKVGEGVKGIKGITVDPTVEGLKTLGEEVIKSFKKILKNEGEESQQ